jgi:ABC-type polysaccharide/polyol phosphate transport system ATPase subunit
MARIEVHNLQIRFRARKRGQTTLKDVFLRQLLRRPPPPSIEVEAISDLTFSACDGHRVGIIGHNGAGKSTLLKALCGVYRPTRGTCKVTGRVCSLFEISLGFEPDATGWENVFYRGYLQRETPQRMREKLQGIADFTELGPALDRPIRYYSTGMLVRLAFAISTSIDPEVLLVDEVLSAGDLAFQEKARKRMKELINRAGIMVLASHDLRSVEELCNRVLWLENGLLRMKGTPDVVIPAYQNYMAQKAQAA